MVYNDIFPGFAWSQVFRFPAGVFLAGQSLRADFRDNPARPPIFQLAEGSGIVRVGDDFTVNLTDVQTTELSGKGRVYFDFVREAPAGDTALGVRVRVPISASFTGPTP